MGRKSDRRGHGPSADGVLPLMATAAPRLATYADLLALSDDVRAEVLAGEVVTAPAPLPRHSKVQRAASRFIGGPFDDDDGRGGPGGWWIFVEVGVYDESARARMSPFEAIELEVGRLFLPREADEPPPDVPTG